MRSVTKQAVKEARLKEIKQELLNSEKLKVSDGCSEVVENACKRFCDWTFVCRRSDLFRGQPQRSAATPTRQRPPSRRGQTPHEERARLPQ